MTLRWILAALHLLGLAIGLGAVWARGRALDGQTDGAAVRRALVADNWWGISALLSFSTGLHRLFAGVEKATAYYLGQPLFWAKIALLTIIVVMELLPMVTLIRWRIALGRGEVPDLRRGQLIASLSGWQAVLLVGVLVLAAGLARGVGSG